MKNKKFSQWLHRLPLLLLALILAVMPLSIAAPVSASVLDTPGDYYYGAVSVPYYGDLVVNLSFTTDFIGNGYVVVYNAIDYSFDFYTWNVSATQAVDWYLSQVQDSDPGIFSFRLAPWLSSGVVFYKSSIEYSPDNIGDSVDLHFTRFEPISGVDGQHPITAFVLAAASDRYGGVGNSPGFSALQHYSAPAVTIPVVFSGVGIWLSGAVQNISTMFWTAESGMTVLGYLVVASLALVVILLIFYFIAGWLKFH